MNRILAGLALVISGPYVLWAFADRLSAADEFTANRDAAAGTNDSDSNVSRSLNKPGLSQQQSNASSAASSGRRDYRRELQYDSSILEIRSQLHGIARPSRNAVMSSLVPGRIMTIHAEEGTRVSAGDRLISLDDRLAQAQVDAARIEASRVGSLHRAEQAFLQSERRLNRLQQASLRSATAGFELEEARSLMEQAQAERDAAKEARAVSEANLHLAEEQLRRNTFYAPFSGVVVQVHQKPGTTVDGSMPVITIANLDILEIEMYVPVDRFGTLQVGRKTNVMAGSPVDQVLTATVRSVSPVIDSASNTFRCVMTIDNSQGRLPAGFSVVLTDGTPTEQSPVAQKNQSRTVLK